MSSCKVIVVEGPDKVGKETQSKMLVASLRTQGKRAALVEVPVKDSVTYKVIYWALRNGMAKALPEVFQYVQYLNKRMFQEFKLKKLMKENDYVVLDRWRLSSVIYGHAEHVNVEFTKKLYDKLMPPDATVILLGKKHIDRKDDAYEKDTWLQSLVSNGYRDWAKDNVGEPVRVVPCEGMRGKVHEKVVAALKDMGVV